MNNFFQITLRVLFFNLVFFTGVLTVSGQKDSTFYCNAFETERDYRIYLPVDYYDNPGKKYPVVYYFHGYGGRYKWDEYELTDDPDYPENGRVHPPYVMEWKKYSQTHDVIIVTWDGYEPLYETGEKGIREGIPYGWCEPYDYPRAHENKSQIKHRGWDFRMQFRELVAHIDSNYHTIADRDHRAITGLSMGGLMAFYVAGQSKDYVASMSAFCPADVTPYFGPKDYISVFHDLEFYRSLKGINVRLSYTDGDWLHAHDVRVKGIMEGSGFESFESHEAVFFDHWAADIDKQLDYHMEEFQKIHVRPDNWNHICSAYKSFDQWGYTFNVERVDPALTILERVSKNHMKIFSREFVPDGPVITTETIGVSTDTIYTPQGNYGIVVYNLTSGEFSEQNRSATSEGRLEFDLPGGGNIVGIHKGDYIPDLFVVNKNNSDYLYFEAGKQYSLDFSLVNVGNAEASGIKIKAFSRHPKITFSNDEVSIEGIGSKKALEVDSAFNFSFNGFKEENFMGNIQLQISIGNTVVDTQKIVFYATPESPYTENSDFIVLDGRFERNVPVYNQCNNSVRNVTLNGGKGNGNGIPEKGEEVLIYVKLAQGLSPNDKNAYHKTYLIGQYNDTRVSVKKLKYDEKDCQAGATSISSFIKIGDTVEEKDTIDLWLRVESLYNDRNPGVTVRRYPYEFHYDYRKVKMILSGEAPKYKIEKEIDGMGSISISPSDSLFDFGQEVTITALPDTGWSFSGWWGDFLGYTNPYILTIERNILAYASFTQIATSVNEEKGMFDISASPNPFTETTIIHYSLGNSGQTLLSIYDMQGKKIREFKNESERPGSFSVEWDGKDSFQKSCPPGIYFYSLLMSDNVIVKRMVKL